MRAQNENLKKTSDEIDSRISMNKAAEAEAYSNAMLKDASAKQLQLAMPGLKNQSDFDNSFIGKAVNYISNLMRPAGSLIGTARQAAGIIGK